MKKIIGIGNALVDILIPVNSDEALSQMNLPKGSMQLVDFNRAEEVLEFTQKLNKSMASGGSAANAIHGLANLGVDAGFIGRIGHDEYGEFFKKDMMEANIRPYLGLSATRTGTAIAFITPDSERTFATYLGAAVELNSEDIIPDIIKNFDIALLEGYLVFNHEFFESTLKKCKEEGLEIALDLSSYNIVEANLDFFREMTMKYVDIVFANEEEAKAFTGKEPEDALNDISELCKIAIVKTGSKGSMIKTKGQVYKIPPVKVSPVDTTGAGDLYAGGFLYGYSSDLPWEACGRIGSLTAGKVIEVMGAKLDRKAWLEILSEIRNYA